MGSKVFYPHSTPSFLVPDNQVLPTVAVGLGTKVLRYPSGDTYLWTGAEWIPFEDSLSKLVAILSEIKNQNKRLLEIMESIISNKEVV